MLRRPLGGASPSGAETSFAPRPRPVTCNWANAPSPSRSSRKGPLESRRKQPGTQEPHHGLMPQPAPAIAPQPSTSAASAAQGPTAASTSSHAALGGGSSTRGPVGLHLESRNLELGSTSNRVPKPQRPVSPGTLPPRSGRKPGELDSPLLNKLIKETRSWQDVSVLVGSHGDQFNFIHVAAVLTHLAQLKGASTEAAAKAFRASMPCMLSTASAANLHATSEAAWPRCTPAEGPASTSTSSSRATSSPALRPPDVVPPSCSAEYLALVDRLLLMTSSHMHQFGARQANNVMWALAQLHPHPGCAALMGEMLPRVRMLLPWCEPQHLANSIWAVAKAGLLPDDDWIEDFLVVSEHAMPGFQPQHLGNTLWGLARLGIAPDGAWMDAFFAQLERCVGLLAPIDVSHVLHGLASLAFEPSQAQAEMLTRVYLQLLPARGARQPAAGPAAETPAAAPRAQRGAGEQAPSLGSSVRRSLEAPVSSKRGAATPQAIANSMWALATMSVLPSKAWVEQLFDEVELRLHEFEPQALSSLLWAAATLGQPLPPTLMQRVYRDSLPHLASFPPRSLSNMIWAVAASLPPPASSSFTGSVRSASARPAPSVSHPADPGALPPKAWTAAFLAAFQAQLPSCSDQAASNVMWALARLGVTPEPQLASAVLLHLQALEAAAGPEAGVSGQALSNCLWAMSKLGFRLSDQAADVVVGMVRRQLLLIAQSGSGPASRGAPVADGGRDLASLLSASEVAAVLYSFGKLNHRPPEDVTELLLEAIARHLALLPPQHQQRQQQQQQQQQAASGSLSAQDLSNVIWAVSALGLNPGPAWLAAFWSRCCAQLPSFNTKDLAQTTYSLAKIGWRPSHAAPQPLPDAAAAAAGPAGSVDALSAEAALEASWPGAASQLPGPSSLPAHLPAAPLAVSRSRKATLADSKAQEDAAPQPPGMALLLSEAAAAFGRYNSQDLANLSWGLAQMDVRPGQAWCRGLAEVLQRRSDQLQGSHLATSLWALGRMGFRPAARSLLPIEGALFRRMPALKPRELSACAWAFAAMGYTPDVQWLEAFSEQCMLTAAEFSQQDWSVVVYSLASIAEQEQDAVIYLEDLFISPQLEAQVHKFSPSTLAMLTYACGILGTRSARLLTRLLGAARPHLAEFKAQELSAVLCTAARLEYVPDPRFVSAWLATFEARMVTMGGPVLAACAWALAKLGIDPAPEWQQTFARVLAERLPELRPREVAMVVWALGEWATPLDGSMVASLGRLVGAGQPEYNRVVRRNLTWAMMKLKTKSKAADRQRARVSKGFASGRGAAATATAVRPAASSAGPATAETA